MQMANPYFFETARGLIGQHIIVQTGQQIQQGILTAVLPDHLVVDICQTPFFIRMDEIVWVTVSHRHS